MIKLKRFLLVVIIEIVLLIIANPIINNITHNTRMEAGSLSLYGPLVFYEKLYSNSQLISRGFNLTNFIINLIIILAIALVLSYQKIKE